MHFSKRRNEWLHGRLAAKVLLRRCNIAYYDLKADEITIANENEGAPYYIIRGNERIAANLTISHRDDIAFCCMTQTPRVSIGADVEKVEMRAREFIGDYFTPEEVSLLNAYQQKFPYDFLVNLVWSAKEAVLKACRKGLRLDTRNVDILSIGSLREGEKQPFWGRIDVHVVGYEGAWSVWWRAEQGYVFTIAIWIKEMTRSGISLRHVSVNKTHIEEISLIDYSS